MDNSESGVELCRRVNAAPEMVFAAFADPGLVSRWLKPAPEVRLEVLSFEFASAAPTASPIMFPAGRSCTSMASLAWSSRQRASSSPGTSSRPTSMRASSPKVRVAIAADGAGSELRIQHLNLSQSGAAERHAEGWRGALDQLAGLVKTGDRT
jgi:uncharacterized protein YndB with AHSA1/START domain